MRRLTEGWFEFDGVRSSALGLRLMEMPARPLPARKGEKARVPGRNGYVWIPEGYTYEPIEIPVRCRTTNDADIARILASLNGDQEKWLRFSDDPAHAYKARLLDAGRRENVFLRFDTQLLTLAFYCQPFRYIYPEPTASVRTTAGNVTNPGTMPSQPRITVAATGDYMLRVGLTSIEVTGGGVIIDSERMEVYDLNGVGLASSRVTMSEFPLLPADGARVSWTGNVSSVSVERRPRDL